MNRRKLSAKERKKVHEKMGGHCAYCGEIITISQMQVDHIVPISRGGADEMGNMFPACRSCNHYKSTLSVENFRAALEHMPEVLMRNN